jgi:hypothetical protein
LFSYVLGQKITKKSYIPPWEPTELLEQSKKAKWNAMGWGGGGLQELPLVPLPGIFSYAEILKLYSISGSHSTAYHPEFGLR